MTDRQSDRRRRARLGVALIGGIVLASLSVFFLDTIVRASSEGPRIAVRTSAAPGLEPGSTVWVAGRPVGRVLDVRFLPPGESEGGAVVIDAVLQRSVRPVLRADATAEVKSPGLLEPVVVAIDPGTGTAPPWDFADTLRTPTDVLTNEDLLAMADTLLRSRAGLAASGRALRDRIRRGGGTLASLEAHPDVLREAADGAARVREALERGDFADGTIGSLDRDTLIAARLGRIKARVARLDSTWADGSSAGGLARATRSLDSLHARLARLSKRLDAGEGTVGRALVDGAIARQTALLRARLDSLVVELVRDPSGWLRVRVF